MNDKTWTIIGTVFSVFGTGASLYSVIENKGIVFNLSTLVFVTILVLGIVLIVVFGTRYKRKKQKKFSNGILEVIADYGNESVIYLTIKNKSFYAIKNVKIEVTTNSNHEFWHMPCLTNSNLIELLNCNKTIVRKIDLGNYKQSLDVAIIWTDYHGSQYVFRISI